MNKNIFFTGVVKENYPALSGEELSDFFKNLNKANPFAAILSVRSTICFR